MIFQTNPQTCPVPMGQFAPIFTVFKLSGQYG